MRLFKIEPCLLPSKCLAGRTDRHIVRYACDLPGEIVTVFPSHPFTLQTSLPIPLFSAAVLW